jgi:hypothetical protein
MKRFPSDDSTGSSQLSPDYDPEAQKPEMNDDVAIEGAGPLRARWARIRRIIREPVAEFFGTMVLVIFGCGVNAQVTLSHNVNVAGAPTGVCSLSLD